MSPKNVSSETRQQRRVREREEGRRLAKGARAFAENGLSLCFPTDCPLYGSGHQPAAAAAVAAAAAANYSAPP